MKVTKAGVLRINFRDFLAGDNRRVRCNYRCDYCNQAFAREVTFTSDDFAEVCRMWNKLRDIEDRLLVKANFDGEIFADHWAQKICFYVANLPNVSRFEFITNNSVDPDVYMGYIDPAKTVFNCSFHPDFVSTSRFIEYIQKIKSYGSATFATIVVTPKMVKQLDLFVTRFRNEGILLKPLLLLGWYHPDVPKVLKRIHRDISRVLRVLGVQAMYPAAYSKEALSIIKQYCYSDLEFEYQYGKRTKGELCYAGVDMINLFKDGTIMRCFGGKLGTVDDLVTGRLQLAIQPYPCFAKRCQCPTHMIFLRVFRERFQLCDDFLDHYYPKKGLLYSEKREDAFLNLSSFRSIKA